MIQPKNETEDLLLSITKNCEKLVEQTHRKAEETLEFKMLKPRETFHFNPPFHTKGDWMIGLIDLEIYNSIFDITEENNKFMIYTDTFDKLSFHKLQDEVAEILNIPTITDDHLDDKATADRIAETYWKLRSDKVTHDGYIILLTGYARSLFRDFESYLRLAVGLEEENIRLILKQYNEKFITYELDPGNYNIEDIHQAVYSLDDHKGNIQIEYDEINKKVKLILSSFANGFGTLRFDDNSFFHTLLGFDPYWDYKPSIAIHAVFPGVYTNDKDFLNLNTINKIHLKCDCIDGSIQDGIRQPILFSFVLDKPSGYKIFCEPETIHHKKNKSVFNTITFYLEDDNNQIVDFNQETLTFTLQMIKI